MLPVAKQLFLLFCVGVLLRSPPVASAPAASRPTGHSDIDSSTSLPTGGSPSPRRVHILFTTDIFGRFAWPACEQSAPRDRANLAHLVGAVRTLRQRITASGAPPPVVLHAGSLLRFDVMGAHCFGQRGRLARDSAGLIHSVGFDAISMGIHDYGANPTTLARYMGLVGARTPLLSSNVRCRGGKDFRCGLLAGIDRQYLVVKRAGVKIGIFSVVRDDLVQRILAQSSGSLSVEPAVAEARKLVRLLRSQSVDAVVMLAELNVEGHAPAAVMSLMRRLGPDAPDLVIAGNMYERRGEDYLLQLRKGTGKVVVGTGRFGQHLGHAVLTLGAKGAGRQPAKIAVDKHRVVDFPPDPKALVTANALMRDLCVSLNQEMAGAYFPQPMPREAFLTYVMNVLRVETRAELALLNDSSVADTGFPMRGKLRREHLLRAIRTETAVGTFRITGAKLKALLAAHVDPESPLHVLGLSKRGSDWFVNERPLIAGQRYRVATTAFVGGGGDGILKLPKERFSSTRRSLRQMVLAFFDAQGANRDGDPAVSVTADFPALHSRWLLFSAFELGGFLSTVSLNNGADGRRFKRPLLVRDNVTDISTELKAHLGASTINHVFEVDGLLQYGRVWTRSQTATTSTEAESKDLVQANALYKSQLLRNRYGSGRWYLPDIYGEIAVLSELTPSRNYADASGDKHGYHYLELGGVLGAGLTPHPLLFLKAGLAFRDEVLTPDAARPDINGDLGLYLGYTLRKLKLLSTTEHPLELESRLDVYFTELGSELRRELTLRSKVGIKLYEWLTFALTHRFFAFASRDRDTSTAHDIQLGVQLTWDYRHQRF